MANQDLPELLDVVVIQVTASMFAVAARDVLRVTLFGDPLAVMKVPCAPKALQGIAVVDGTPALMIDLAEALDAVTTASTTRQVACEKSGPTLPAVGIVCRGEGETTVLVGGQVRSMGRLRIADSPPVPRTALATDAVEWRGRAVPVLSVPRLIDSVSAPRDIRSSHER